MCARRGLRVRPPRSPASCENRSPPPPAEAGGDVERRQPEANCGIPAGAGRRVRSSTPARRYRHPAAAEGTVRVPGQAALADRIFCRKRSAHRLRRDDARRSQSLAAKLLSRVACAPAASIRWPSIARTTGCSPASCGRAMNVNTRGVLRPRGIEIRSEIQQCPSPEGRGIAARDRRQTLPACIAPGCAAGAAHGETDIPVCFSEPPNRQECLYHAGRSPQSRRTRPPIPGGVTLPACIAPPGPLASRPELCPTPSSRR